ncbi:MAG: hypothetical protein JWM97_1960 [Phycisphaerales bacterium]|jgi:hypothetical protein|nr:hypothetical protein [Phycisphaerales bacterium]
MVALPLFDVILASDESPERARGFAAQVVRASLSDLGQIEKLDENLMPEGSSLFDRQKAVLLRGMYEEWARQTEGVLYRLGRLEKRSILVEGAGELRDGYGRTRAMLSVSPEQVEAAERDLEAGKVTPLEEVRRELQLGAR